MERSAATEFRTSRSRPWRHVGRVCSRKACISFLAMRNSFAVTVHRGTFPSPLVGQSPPSLPPAARFPREFRMAINNAQVRFSLRTEKFDRSTFYAYPVNGYHHQCLQQELGRPVSRFFVSTDLVDEEYMRKAQR